MRDHRLYLNAIRAIVAQMQEAGLQVEISQRDMRSGVEMTVRVLPRRRSRQQLHGDIVMPIAETFAHSTEAE